MSARFQPYSSRHKRRRVRQELDNLNSLQVDGQVLNNIQNDEVVDPLIEPETFGENSNLSDDDYLSCVSNEDSLNDSSNDDSSGSDDDVVANVLRRIDALEIQDNDETDEAGEVVLPEDSLNFRQLLAEWVVQWGVCQNAVDCLLNICRLFSWGFDLPKTCRSLVKTPRSVQIKDVNPGQYHHFGILKGLISILMYVPEDDIPSEIVIFVNMDGIPIAKSSGSQFWPILGMVSNIHFRKPFMIELYHGNQKATESNEYLADFVNEVHNLRANGVKFRGRVLEFRVGAFICDAPARAYILKVKGHCAYFGCTRCIQQGEFEGRVVFLERDSSLRTDSTFRNRVHADHHLGESALEELDIDMVLDFPVDPMHLVDLGVTRKLSLTWYRGPLETRLAKLHFDNINIDLENIQDYIPREYPRKTRSFKFIDRMKSTEHALFRSCVGPVVLKNRLPKRQYNNFLVFHVAIRILSSKETCHSQNEYARSLLHLFVKESEVIYGPEFLSYNVHNLIHLPDDVLRFGSLPNFAAYPFENYLQVLKKMLRKCDRPLQQIVRRVTELENVETSIKKQDTGVKRCILRREHFGGPLVPDINPEKQFKELKFNNYFLNCSVPYSCVYLNDSTVVVISNFVRTGGKNFIIGKRFRKKQNLYDYPVFSSSLCIFWVSDLSDDFESWLVDLIKWKAVKIPLSAENNDSFAVFPLLMEGHN